MALINELKKIMNYNQEIKLAMGNEWRRTCDLVDIYYDVGARLRSWYRQGICDKKKVGKFTYYKLKDGSDVQQGLSGDEAVGEKQTELFKEPTKPRPHFPY